MIHTTGYSRWVLVQAKTAVATHHGTHSTDTRSPRTQQPLGAHGRADVRGANGILADLHARHILAGVSKRR